MEIRLLGPLEVERRGRVVEVAGRRLRSSLPCRRCRRQGGWWRPSGWSTCLGRGGAERARQPLLAVTLEGLAVARRPW